jgi:hypothetical protein
MSSTDPRESRFDGVRVRFDSDKTYHELVAALLADIGEKPVTISNPPATTSHDWDTFSAEITRHLGPSDFMLMHLIDHGEWLKSAGIGRRALRAIIGNPLTAITMLRHDLTAGLFVLVELLPLEEDHDRSSLTYVRPSSLMVIDDNPPLRAAARAVDGKLAALAAKVSATKLADVPMGGAI